jgi:hypothetical protein
MRSAFGVEHYELSKAFRKIAPKLEAASRALESRPRAGIAGAGKENYAQWRLQAGRPGPRSREYRIKDKEGAQAWVTAAGNREGRKLP